ncbi:DUF2339 domain-containing protein [Flavobacterium algicola]|uniref:DUF2339 domain-containing protein n=1 Tax=Flavobacterium algicola TaxID=556529 RepID=UPI001EFDB01D|nr:DUF2339 domain-containing protein [Flavobacterium algicola]MCG9793066.1 DUF2339 domain-containing protein [Flavobacterium algicola]
MEFFSGIIVVALFLFINSKFSKLDSKFISLDAELKALNRKLAALQKDQTVPKKEESRSTETFEKEIPISETVNIPESVPVQEDIVESVNKVPDEALPVMESITKPDTIEPSEKPKIAIKYEPKKSFWERFREKNPDLEKFIGEDLISKIGVLILVLGISYFVKFAIDKDWINEPARVGIGMLCGSLVLAVAHKLRQNYAAFSSVLVAGAIAIFYFTIGIAFHTYHLFSQTVAFIIMVSITAFSCLISLSYNRKELAVLSLIGGFAVPFMVSAGQGNYIVLFTYISILNVGILAIAYFKRWSIINILSYIFTVFLYGGWLYRDITSEAPHYVGAIVFAFVFYFIFILTNIINNLRTKGIFSTTELSILASNTFLFYAAVMIVLNDFHPELRGLFTTLLGLLNFTYAWFLYKKFGLDKTAVYLLIGLTLTFITLAIPIQFEGHSITLFWAAESVLLFWLSQKSKITSYLFGSVIVYILMIISLVIDWGTIYSDENVLTILFNKIAITGIFATLSSSAIYFLLKKDNNNYSQYGITLNAAKYRSFIQIMTVILAYLTGIFEVSFQSDYYVAGPSSVASVIALYHLLFTGLLFYFLSKSKITYKLNTAVILAVVNILIYTFIFSNFAFNEHKSYISNGLEQRIAFYLHYFSITITAYLGFAFFKIKDRVPFLNIFNKSLWIWIGTFLIIYLASTELLLHGLLLSDSTLTIADIKASPLYDVTENYNTNSLSYLKSEIADAVISNTKIKIIKTGFPILWGIFAFTFLLFGIKKRNKTLRIAALVVLGITILKLFIYDISNASETGKIIAFILLGVLILIISYVYQKIKVLVQDDSINNKSNEVE